MFHPEFIQMILVANEREVLTKCHDEVLHIIDDALLYQFLVLVFISHKQLFRVDIVQQILVLEFFTYTLRFRSCGLFRGTHGFALRTHKALPLTRSGRCPIREGVVNIKPDTTMKDLLRYAERVHERWGIRAIQIHIHKDEGHYEMMEQRAQCQANLNIAESRQNSAEPATEDSASWEPNYHAHIIWDWMDHDRGKSFKLNAEDMSAIQDLVAETLDMQRGQKKSETGIDHLERNDFIIQKQDNKKKQLQEEAKKAIAEKEEANAEVEAAKTEVADLWKEHDYLTSANRTKAERSNRLDLDIRNKTNRSQALDDAIDAKKQEVGKLSAKADEKLRDFYTIKERGNWQDPMFFAMSAYIYRIDEGLQFCIKAIQDYAYSGFGGRGGKHGDIFWDNESYAGGVSHNDNSPCIRLFYFFLIVNSTFCIPRL